MTRVVNKRTHGGRFSGYGWPATLELLSPPINAADSRHSFKMVVCPFCDSVHESGGDCPASRHPIRFFIDSPANLTLLEAWTWIHNLTRNESGNVTSFPLVVTGETRTLGLDPMVLNVLPNVTVENSGNHSEPPPPVRQKTFWELAWNTFTGIVSTVWNVVVAVATFIANAALAVVKWAIGFAKAIASGQGLQYFYDTVVKPFVEAVLAFIRWIIDLVKAFLSMVFSPISSFIKGAIESVTKPFLGSLVQLVKEVEQMGDASLGTKRKLGQALFGDRFLVIFATVVIIEIILAAVTIMTLPFSFIISLIIGVVLDFILVALFGAVLNTNSGSSFTGTEPTFEAASLTAISLQTEGGGSGLTTPVLAILSAIYGAISTSRAAVLLEAAKASHLPWFILGVGIAIVFVAVFVEIYVGLTQPPPVSGTASQALGITVAILGILDCVLTATAKVTPDQRDTKCVAFATGSAAVILGLASSMV